MPFMFGDNVQITEGQYKGQTGVIVSVTPLNPTLEGAENEPVCKVQLDKSEKVIDCEESKLIKIVEDEGQ